MVGYVRQSESDHNQMSEAKDITNNNNYNSSAGPGDWLAKFSVKLRNLFQKLTAAVFHSVRAWHMAVGSDLQ